MSIAKRPIAARVMSPIRSGLARILGHVLDFVMPAVCLACREPVASHDSLCPDCWRQIDFISQPLCDRLGLPMPYATGDIMISAAAAAAPPRYARARAVARYDGTMARLIKGFKFDDRLEARSLLGTLLLQAGGELIADADVMVPVPLARSRLFHRRFNQSAVLGKELSARCGLPFAPLALVRTRATRSQVGLSNQQRQENVRAAFAVPARARALIDGRRVLLIDDVITTGATANAATEALMEAGARAVDVLALGLVTSPTHMTM